MNAAHTGRLALRALGLVVLFFCTSSPAASHRTQNFIVTTDSPQLAVELCNAAEQYRRELAIEWLGHELPPWGQPCPITVQAAPHLGAGGKTSFMFEERMPFGWRMSIQGSRERLLDSVLPHEVTHTIFATHFGRPLPRWADEGACTTVEHPSEREKQQQFLIQFMSSNPPRSIPFNKMFRMRDYPHDIMPLYSQGHSVARFLIQQGGKRKFIDFVGRGMDTDNWDQATQEFYGFRDLSELQVDWVAWVEGGSRPLGPSDFAARSPMLASDGTQSFAPNYFASAQPRSSELQAVPPLPNERKLPQLKGAATPHSTSGSWYARGHKPLPKMPVSTKQGATRSLLAQNQDREPWLPGSARVASSQIFRSTSRPQPTQGVQQQVLEWDRRPAATANAGAQYRRKVPATDILYMDPSHRLLR